MDLKYDSVNQKEKKKHFNVANEVEVSSWSSLVVVCGSSVESTVPHFTSGPHSNYLFKL